MKNKIDFEKYAKRQIYFEKNLIKPEIKKILNKISKKNKEFSLLDIGAGDGGFVKSIEKSYPFCKISISDISQIRLERIKKLISNLKNSYFEDINHSKIPSNKFNFVNSDQVIEHVPSDKKMILEIKRILKKGGYFKVSSVYKKSWAWYFYRCNGKWVLDPTHIREYTSINQFSNLFKIKSIKIEKVYIKKTYFPIADFFLRLLKINRMNKIIYLIRKLKIRIPGYYHITVIGVKNEK